MPRYTFHPDGKKLSGKRKEKEEKWGQRKGEKKQVKSSAPEVTKVARVGQE